MNRIIKKRILIVDDEAEVRSLISTYLKQRNFIIDETENGKEAQEAIKKSKPDLIILDVLMPVMDGFTFLEKLKNNPDYADIPVIMLTVKSESENLGKGILLKADFYLPKPFKLENLMNFIKLLL